MARVHRDQRNTKQTTAVCALKRRHNAQYPSFPSTLPACAAHTSTREHGQAVFCVSSAAGARTDLWHVIADRPEIGVERVRKEDGLQFLLLLFLRRTSTPAFSFTLSFRHVTERLPYSLPSPLGVVVVSAQSTARSAFRPLQSLSLISRSRRFIGRGVFPAILLAERDSQQIRDIHKHANTVLCVLPVVGRLL